MKGLLVKDFLLMKNQKQFFIVTTLLAVLFLFTFDNPNFSISYTIIMFGMFTLTSISYDQLDNGNVYLFSLPVSRKKYVLEKYLFGLIITCSWAMISVILTLIVYLLRHTPFSAEDLIGSALGGLLVSLLMQIYSIPIHLKFGVDKNRSMMVLFSVILVAVVLVGIKALNHAGSDSSKLLTAMHQLQTQIDRNPLLLAALALLVLAALALVSCRISMRILGRKEF